MPFPVGAPPSFNVISAEEQQSAVNRYPQPQVPEMPEGWTAKFDFQVGKFLFTHKNQTAPQTRIPGLDPAWAATFRVEAGRYEYYPANRPDQKQWDAPPSTGNSLDFRDYGYAKPAAQRERSHHSQGQGMRNQLLGSASAAGVPGTKRPSPSVQEWVNSVPELAGIEGLTSWKAICQHVGVDVKTDSARRKLHAFVRNNKPSWPAVPKADDV